MRPQELYDLAPPNDPEAEMWVLGSIVLKSDCLDDIAGIVTAEDFYGVGRAAVFATLQAMHGDNRKIDMGLLVRALEADGTLAQIGGTAGLAQMIQEVPTWRHAEHYAGIVREKSARRRLLDAGVRAMQAAHDVGTPIADLVAMMETAVASIETTPHSQGVATAQEAAVEFLDYLQSLEGDQCGGVMTGVETLDTDTGGLHPGELTILAARPGVGKTALAMQIACHAADRDRLVYYASLEMSPRELAGRQACGDANVSLQEVRAGRLNEDDRRALVSAANRFGLRSLVIDKRPELTVYDIRRAARKLKRQGLSMVVVDYLQLVRPADRRIPRHEAVGQMTRDLKELARELEIPLLVLCQLNRESEKDGKPKLSHLRESGSIEQDADAVWLLTPHAPKADEPHNTELLIAKNRNGHRGRIRLDWDARRTRFAAYRAAAEDMPNYEPDFAGDDF